jgi:RND family efflux transporter MFP subunit
MAGLMLAAACGGNGPANGAAGGPGGGGRGGPPMAVPVGIKTLAEQPVEQTGEFVGTVKSRRTATIQPQVEGFLTRILVKSGDRVAQGAPLFEIDASTLQAGIASLESVRAAREADAAFARQQAERAKTLLAVGATSQQEYEQALTQQKTAEAQLKATEEQIKQQRTELSYYRVTAPTDGVVGDIPVRVGDRVTRATELTTVQDTGGLELYVNVPVQEAHKLKPGLVVRIPNEAGEVVATERINFIAPSVDDTTQTVLVKTPVTARGFRPDQFVRVSIVFDSAPGLTIPLTAVTRISGQQFVFVAEKAEGGLVAKQRAVTLGPLVGNDYLVLNGVKAGEQVVISGIQMIGDGVPVQPAKPGGAPGPGGAGPGRGGQP